MQIPLTFFAGDKIIQENRQMNLPDESELMHAQPHPSVTAVFLFQTSCGWYGVMQKWSEPTPDAKAITMQHCERGRSPSLSELQFPYLYKV